MQYDWRNNNVSYMSAGHVHNGEPFVWCTVSQRQCWADQSPRQEEACSEAKPELCTPAASLVSDLTEQIIHKIHCIIYMPLAVSSATRTVGNLYQWIFTCWFLYLLSFLLVWQISVTVKFVAKNHGHHRTGEPLPTPFCAWPLSICDVQVPQRFTFTAAQIYPQLFIPLLCLRWQPQPW